MQYTIEYTGEHFQVVIYMSAADCNPKTIAPFASKAAAHNYVLNLFH